jgi:hypothetical protein
VADVDELEREVLSGDTTTNDATGAASAIAELQRQREAAERRLHDVVEQRLAALPGEMARARAAMGKAIAYGEDGRSHQRELERLAAEAEGFASAKAELTQHIAQLSEEMEAANHRDVLEQMERADALAREARTPIYTEVRTFFFETFRPLVEEHERFRIQQPVAARIPSSASTAYHASVRDNLRARQMNDSLSARRRLTELEDALKRYLSNPG